MGPSIVFTLQNMPSENKDLYVPFCYETNNAFTLQNMSSEIQDLNVPFCYQTGHCLYFAEYARKIKIYMCPFVMRLDTAFTFLNMSSEDVIYMHPLARKRKLPLRRHILQGKGSVWCDNKRVYSDLLSRICPPKNKIFMNPFLMRSNNNSPW